MNTIFFQQARAFIIAAAYLLSDSLRTAIEASKANAISLFNFREKELFVRIQASDASGIFQLLKDTTKLTKGVCSFQDGGYMGDNEAAVIRKITVLYGVGNDAVSPASINYNTALPAALANAELIIKSDEDEILRKTVRRLSPRGNETTAGDELLDLNQFLLLRDARKVSAEIHFADGQSLPAAGAGSTPYISLSLDGLVTRKK